MLASTLFAKSELKNKHIVLEIQKSIARVERIVNSTLLFTKGVHINKQPFNLKELQDECELVISSYNYNCEIDFEFDFIDLVINADKALLSLVLQNLIYNSIDAIEEKEDEKAFIKIKTCVKDGCLLVQVFDSGVEIKDGTSRQWMAMAGDDVFCALMGKLLPHTLIFFAVAAAYDVFLYGVLGFPCHSGIGPLLLATLLWVVASQAFGVFLIAVLPTLRLALSACSLWGVVSFSISGFSFPVMAMHPALQALSNLFPLRHYFLIYVSQTLNGYPMAYVWRSYFALLLFVLLPMLFLRRLKTVLLEYDYIP